MNHARPEYIRKVFAELEQLIASGDTFTWTTNGFALFNLIQMMQVALMSRAVPNKLKVTWKSICDDHITLIEDANPEFARLLRLGYLENKDKPT